MAVTTNHPVIRLAAVLMALVLVLSTVGIVLAAPSDGGPTQDVLVGFYGTPNPGLVQAFGGEVTHEYWLIPAVAARVPAGAVAGLERHPAIAYVEADGRAFALAEQTPWGIDRVNAPDVHAGGNVGQGVTVAVLDTGVDYTHPDLADRFGAVKGYDVVNTDTDPMDDEGHGTHVAGTIAASANGQGVVGVAPGATLYAVKVLGADGSGSYSGIIAGIEWAVAGPDGTPGTADDADVISMSLGGETGTSALQQAIDEAYFDHGVLVVAAAGNDGGKNPWDDDVSYPAAYDGAIAVTAIDSSNAIAGFSSYGPEAELTAPGVSVTSTLPGNSYGTYSGTSMATPHVSGVAALVFASAVDPVYDANGNGAWDASEVRARLGDTATDLGASGRDDFYGYGLVNAAAAVGSGSSDPGTAPSVAIGSPSEGVTLSGSVSITASASDAETDDGSLVGEFSVDGGAWQPMANDGAGGLSASWDSATVGDGIHAIAVRVTDGDDATATDSVSVTTENVDDAPSVSITAPADGATVTDQVTLEATASDPEGAALTVEYTVDGGTTWIPMSGDGSSTYTATWDTATVADGGYAITVLASDGTTPPTTDSVGVTVANDVASTSPVLEPISVVDPSPNNPHAEIQVDWSVSDVDGDELTVLVTVEGDDGSSAGATSTVAGTGSGSNYFEFKHGFRNGGSYLVTVTVTDDDGNVDAKSAVLTG